MTNEGRVVGIDLGTSNTVVAVSQGAAARVVPLVQYTDVNETEGLPQLPSAVYGVLAEENFATHPAQPGWVVGQYARRRGAEVPERVITSAKSWLCHAGIDRTAAILPWVSRRHEEDEDETTPKLSPVDASAAILRQVELALKANALPLDDATSVVVTVPASFDQVARQLTLEATTKVGLSVRLLEEPQAAFYDWLHRATPQAIDQLVNNGRGRVVLVVDVGGGTTDLTLLRVTPRDGLSPTELLTLPTQERISVERIAVGRHLLLGGDNIDLTLAHLVDRKFAATKRLTPSEFAQLVATCQAAKERLLGPEPASSVPIRLARRGAALVGNTLKAELTRAEVETLVLDGFLPLDEITTPVTRGKSALLGFGLPFESDPAITHHLGQFLSENNGCVDVVLLNGGFFKSPAIVTRLLDVLSRWMAKPINQLSHAEPDFAVARGAVYYGLALRGTGVRFSGGTPLGYYVGVHSTEATPQAVCVVPKGAAENTILRVENLPLSLAVGKTVRFDLFANRVQQHALGQLVDLADPQFERLTVLSTRLDQGEGNTSQATIPVVLQSALTPVGTLELACVESNPPNRTFELAFELRGSESAANTLVRPNAPRAVPTSTGGINSSSSSLAQAQEVLVRVFGKGRKDVHGREIKDVWRELERLLGSRKQWDLSLARSLADTLLPLAAGRRRSVDHERVFFAVTGYCLRPGFGHARDAERLAQLEPLFEPGLMFHGDRTNWDQFFVTWRRVATGVSEITQGIIRDLCDPFVAPAEHKLKKPKSFKPPEVPVLWDLLSYLERVPAERRGALGQWVLERTWTNRDPKNWDWLGRIGAREPVYGSAHCVVRTRQAEAWLEHLLSEPWDTSVSTTRTSLINAAVELARATNDLARDIQPGLRERVVQRLTNVGATSEAIEAVQGFVPRLRSDNAAAYGEDLPPGLVLGR